MKICLLGDFLGTPDEGMKNISHTLKDKIGKRHDLMAFGLKEVLSLSNIKKLRVFSPQIIHYLHGPTIRSLIILRLVKLLVGSNVKIVVSATRPYFPKSVKWLIPYVIPDLFLTQSQRFEKFILKYNAKISFFPNGVPKKSPSKQIFIF